MFDIVLHTLAANVAQSATFTVAYPTGRSAGSYTGAINHKMFSRGLMTKFESPEGISISFGASEMTVTYKGNTTLPQGSEVRFELQRLGDDANHPEQAVIPDTVRRAGLHILDLGAPITSDADGILNDASATDSVQAHTSLLRSVLDVPRNIILTGTAGSDHVVTVTGKDQFGNVMKEAITLDGTNVIAGKKAFKEVTRIDVAVGAAGDTFDAGWGDVLGLPAYVPDAAYILAELKNGTVLPRAAGKVFIPFVIGATDLSTPTPIELISPVAGRIAALHTTVQVAISTGGDVTMEVDTTLVDGLTISVADSATVGTRQSDTPTAGHASAVVAEGSRIEIIPAAAFNGGGALAGFVEIDTTAAGQLDGTLVAAVTAVATATTGDVRGTYDPSAACDGATQFALLVALPDPALRGVPQYDG